MLQGTGSDVGKSVVVAGICRAFANRGLRVRPFKPQNMSNNAAVTSDGGEIGRAQALQAIACRVEPHTDMNPVLLKPQADRTSQLIVRGKIRGSLGAGNFREARGALLGEVLESYARLRAACDVVVVEGAGSPAEINLRIGDIANMGFARAANVPVVLIGDIDRGGVIAAIVGTRAVIDREDAAMIRGFIINKFRGDPELFADGYARIEELSSWRGFGVVPWLAAAARLPSEDAVILERRREDGARGAVDRLSDPAAHCQFRRPRPIEARARCRVADDFARSADSGGSGAGRACGFQGDDRRSGRAPGRGLGHRHSRASPARRRGAGPVRRLSDAGQAPVRPAGNRGAGRARRGAGPARRRDGADVREGAAAGRRNRARRALRRL